MIETQFHPLDEIVRFGHAVHGLLIKTGGRPSLRVNGVDFELGAPLFPDSLGDRMNVVLGALDFGLPAEDVYDTHLLRVPGISPVSLPPEEVAAEAAQGRTWQHYALLSARGPCLFGHQLGGWVCIDPAGQRWLVRGTGSPNIRYGNARVDLPLTLHFEVTPFGHLDQAPVAPVSLEVSLADIGQNYPGLPLMGDPNVRMRLVSIASHGRQVVIGLFPRGDDVTQDDLPCGWLLLTLAGDGPDFELSLVVLHSREAALGGRSFTDANGQSVKVPNVDMSVTVDGPDEEGYYDLIGTPTGVSLLAVAPGTPGWTIGIREMTYSVAGRICSVVFDEADALVSVTANISWQRTQSLNAPLVDVTGTLSARLSEATPTGSAGGLLTFDLEWNQDDVTTTEIQLLRNGIQVDSAVWSYTVDMAHSQHYGVDADADFVATATLDPPAITVAPNAIIMPRPTTWPIQCRFDVAGITLMDLAPTVHRPNSRPWSPPDWQTRVDIWEEFSADLGDYDTVRYKVRRLCNQVLGCKYEIYRAGTNETPPPPVLDRHHLAVASQALWSNPSPANDPFGELAASYHPFTHELFVNADFAIAQPFVWI